MFLRIDAPHIALQQHVAQHRAPVEQQIALKRETEIGIRAVDDFTVNPHFPDGCFQQPGNKRQKGALAATAGAENGQKLAAADLQIGAFQRHDLLAVLTGECLSDAVDLDQRFSGFRRRRQMAERCRVH